MNPGIANLITATSGLHNKIMSPGIVNLITAINSDPHITNVQQQMLVSKVQEPAFFENIMHGVFGSSLALIVAKYLKLDKTAQVLLAIAGYGIGKALWDAYDNENNFSRYDKQTKTYTIK
jgi:hypothetical protein